MARLEVVSFALWRPRRLHAQDDDETLPRGWTPKGVPTNGPRDWATDTWPYIKNEQDYRCTSRADRVRGFGFNVAGALVLHG